MNNRELFHATMRRENGNELLQLEQGFNIPYQKWIKEGLPAYVENLDWPKLTERENLFDHFNVSGYLFCRFEQFCLPAFEEKVIEKKADRITFTNTNGATLQERLDTSLEGSHRGSPPHEIEFSIKTPKDYEENRYRFTGNIRQRVDYNWLLENGPAYCAQKDFPVPLWTHGPFAYLREIMGVENAMILPYEEPDMIKMILKDHLDICMAAGEPVIKACKPDMCFVWEDCCGRTGPFISPSVFNEIFAPWYRDWKDYLKSMGVEWLMLDTDGNPSPLVKMWYEAGVDCMQPWEVNGVDMLKFAEEFPQYVMMGGIYKHMFEPGDAAQVGRFKSADIKQAIDEELERVVKPMSSRGGYIASLDHWPFWGVTYEGFRYYNERLSANYGKANCVTRSFKSCL